MRKVGLCLIIIYTITLIPILRAQNVWQEVGKMPIPVYGGKAVVIDSMILIIGGSQASASQISRIRPSSLIQAYDPARNTWRNLDTLNFPRYAFAADTIDKNSLLICGGSWQNDLNSYTIEQWSLRNSLSEPEVIFQNALCNRVYFSGHTYRKKFYLFGGMKSPATDVSGHLAEILVFDLTSNRIVFNSDSLARPYLLLYHHASVRIDNMVYLIGGVHDGVTANIRAIDLDKLGSADPAFPEVGKLSNVRAGCDAIVLPDYICVVGGYSENSNALSSTDLISRSKFETFTGPPMHHARKEPMAVVCNGSIYVFGGRTQNEAVVDVIERIKIEDMIPVSTRIPEFISGIPAEFELEQNFPNPFNAGTIIPFRLPEAEVIRIEVSNILGEKVRTLFEGILPSGVHRIQWDATDDRRLPVPSGMYYYSLTNGVDRRTGKMILIR